MWSKRFAISLPTLAPDTPMIQRTIDLVAAALGLIALAPVFLVIAAMIKLTSPGPVFHRAERVGKGGALFILFKFRSMRSGAAAAGPGITRSGDDRITPVGQWLRRSKIDELPQLLNVFRGEMSLVGPRPEDPRYVALYSPEQRRILSARPGITSAASVQYRHEESMLTGVDWEERYVNEVMPAKLQIDMDYLSRRTTASDLGILWQTCLALFR
jgi:lipopolysaccharide/colanic/teichoic acid biosynthesis glycosyltransferase